MNEIEARLLANAALCRLASLGYEALLQLFDVRRADEVRGTDGRTYQVETRVFWDDPKARTLRGCASVADRGLSALVPLTESFVLHPDGMFGQ